MLEAFQAALDTPGLFWLFLTIGAAGLVRGFTGFGTAMIFVPVGAQFLPAADVVFLMVLMGVFSTITLFPQAWSTADKAEVGALAMAAAVTVPGGLWVMFSSTTFSAAGSLEKSPKPASLAAGME